MPGIGSLVAAARTSRAKVMLIMDGSKSRVVALTDLISGGCQIYRVLLTNTGRGKEASSYRKPKSDIKELTSEFSRVLAAFR